MSRTRTRTVQQYQSDRVGVHSKEAGSFTGQCGIQHVAVPSPTDDEPDRKVLTVNCCEADEQTALHLGWFAPADQPIPATFEEKRVADAQRDDVNRNLLSGLTALPDVARTLAELSRRLGAGN